MPEPQKPCAKTNNRRLPNAGDFIYTSTDRLIIDRPITAILSIPSCMDIPLDSPFGDLRSVDRNFLQLEQSPVLRLPDL